MTFGEMVEYFSTHLDFDYYCRPGNSAPVCFSAKDIEEFALSFEEAIADDYEVFRTLEEACAFLVPKEKPWRDVAECSYDEWWRFRPIHPISVKEAYLEGFNHGAECRVGKLVR